MAEEISFAFKMSKDEVLFNLADVYRTQPLVVRQQTYMLVVAPMFAALLLLMGEESVPVALLGAGICTALVFAIVKVRGGRDAAKRTLGLQPRWIEGQIYSFGERVTFSQLHMETSVDWQLITSVKHYPWGLAIFLGPGFMVMPRWAVESKHNELMKLLQAKGIVIR